jgi:hypothetical protein
MPTQHNLLAARKVFDELVAAGTSTEEMIACTRAFIATVESSGATKPPFEIWLASRPWEKSRH